MTTPKTLLPEQTDALLAYLLKPWPMLPIGRPQLRNHLMALLMLDAGLRVGEVVKLASLDLWPLTTVPHSLYISADTSHAHTDRTIPISKRLHNHIETTRPTLSSLTHTNFACYAFWTRLPQIHITTRQVQRIITHAGHASCHCLITPHTLRHTFATRLMRTTNIRVVQQLLGHKSLSSTQIYTHPDAQDLKNAIDKLT